MSLLFPDCATEVSPGAVALVVGLTTGTCFYEGHCRQCTNTSAMISSAPDEFVTLTVAEASRGIVYKTGDIIDKVGGNEYWCDGHLGNVSIAAGSWFLGTPNCTVDHLSVTGSGARIEGATIKSYGRLVGVDLHLVELQGATAVVSPAPRTFSVRCNGLSVENASIAVGGCRDDWSATGSKTVAIYQASTKPTGSPGTLISIDAITGVFGRAYEARFFEGVTDVDSKKEIFETSLAFMGTSLVILFGSWWLTA